jgi:hypothetical protein
MATKAGSCWNRVPDALARAGSALLSSTCLVAPALANPNDFGLRLSILSREGAQPLVVDMSGPLGLIFIGLVILTTTISILHVIGRQRWSRRLTEQDAEIGTLQARLQQADIFMAGERHIVVAWGNASGEPSV